jgi:aryl-alcohol dehydrogenase-like predicted oxidoreductase
VELVFDTPANRERRRRAAELGRRVGATPTQVALAWLAHHPFPVLPIVGPGTVVELQESVEALELELGADDLAFLEAA